ncbi:hypothetical protein [Halorarius halobius]|uniref:hypothetical protein n=1 Tax=Halorarius halobius TaxID=2962671 RepID=UPI0020CE6109|nr:hypothetical protein [Halorarius halobius]
MRGGLDYLTGHVDLSGKIAVIAVGRDAVHSEPLLVTSWSESTHPERGSFVETIFPPEYLAHSFAPDENVRVAYDHEGDVTTTSPLGEWDGVTFFDVASADRRTFIESNEAVFTEDERMFETLVGMLD